MFSHFPVQGTGRTGEGGSEEGRRRFRSGLASVVQVLISVVFPLPGATGTPVFFF